MKKLLIIQQDEAYFLFETLQVIENNPLTFKEYELTLLVDEAALDKVYNKTYPVIKGLITDENKIKSSTFDVSVNFSLRESSWGLHGKINSSRKLGMYLAGEQLMVDDLWSTYLLTLKSKAPFLTFHLQDIYRNILGIKTFVRKPQVVSAIRQFAYSNTSTHLFSADEQEKFIHELALNYPTYPIKDLSEIDLVSDISHSLYIGPANLEALKFCEAGGKGIFLSSTFKGFNLFPYGASHLYLSSCGQKIEAKNLLSVVMGEMAGETNLKGPFAVYRNENESGNCVYLNCLNQSDDNYPFYQSYVVLWNFLLNLVEVDLEITHCSSDQIELLKTHSEILAKVIRLHDYAMSAIDSIYHEGKSPTSDNDSIGQHIKQLLEIEDILDQIATSHPLLRPIIDFYRIRRGQNQGTNLTEQSQSSFLTYAEEHQALQALHELFSVTLRKNEVNI